MKFSLAGCGHVSREQRRFERVRRHLLRRQGGLQQTISICDYHIE